MTDGERQQGVAAYQAYTESLKKAEGLAAPTDRSPPARRPWCGSVLFQDIAVFDAALQPFARDGAGDADEPPAFCRIRLLQKEP
ncbi:hypothetical protein U0042_28675 [Paraburkholderia kururiensis]|uniref:Uncharacterized protein n=1 Tax=Paraburkholderia kururiensis TaxID=984307 RepID=A0ABZ0WKW8_9BURK|nr:hypothetical protein [Paraburkholderia kururiensis]WQD77946.1 hypothetical protein U0042_28675 [Paraburkholderia kururiensis]